VPYFSVRSKTRRVDLAWLPSHRDIPPSIICISKMMKTLKASRVFHLACSAPDDVATTQFAPDSHTATIDEPPGWRILESLAHTEQRDGVLESRPRTGFLNQTLKPHTLSAASSRERSLWFFHREVITRTSYSITLFELAERGAATQEFGQTITVSAQAADHLIAAVIFESKLGHSIIGASQIGTESSEIAFPTPRQTDALHRLSPFEMSILVAMCEGLSNVEIGRRLSKSVSTVRAATSRIYDNLGVRNRQAAISYAAPRLTPPRTKNISILLRALRSALKQSAKASRVKNRHTKGFGLRKF